MTGCAPSFRCGARRRQGLVREMKTLLAALALTSAACAARPKATAKALKRFEPWTPLSYPEGSIGWDIETFPWKELEPFYGQRPAKEGAAEPSRHPAEPGGSNGIAIAPSRTASGAAML